MNRRSHLNPVRRHPWLMLWLVPYLFLSAFGEAFHQHPLDHATSHAQSTLSGTVASLTNSHPGQAAGAPVPEVVQAAAVDCLICAWSAQNAAQLATTPLTMPDVAIVARLAAFEATRKSQFQLALRTRGPPFSSVV